MELTTEQKNKIKSHIAGYNKWSHKEENIKVHRDHHEFFRTMLSNDKIDSLTEDDFREVYKKLWASNIWGNKDWYIDNKLLQPNGLQKIKQELKKLLYGEDEINIRFDNFKKNIKGFGPSSMSEILHFVFPEKYCLWNDKPKTVLPYLGIDFLPAKLFKYNLQTGSEYQQCINALKVVKDELTNYGFENPDFIDLDCFLWYIFANVDFGEEEPKVKEKKPKPSLVIESHEDAEEILLKLGKMMDYLPYLNNTDRSKISNKELLNEILVEIPDCFGGRDKNSAREIDVIWFDADENPKVCLEVEHSTNVSSGLQRLSQLKHFDVKFVIVADEFKRSKFEIEMNKYPYRTMRDKFRFISYEELLDLYETVTNYKQIFNKLFGEE